MRSTLARNGPLDIGSDALVESDPQGGRIRWIGLGDRDRETSFAEREHAPVHCPIPAIHGIQWSPTQGPDGDVEPKRWLRPEDKHAA